MVNFPTTLDDNASLHVAKNNLYTTLNTQLLVGETTTMTVISTTGWDSAGYLSVDNEIIKYASTDATHFLTLTRAQDNTTAAQHEVGTVVELRPVAMHHNDPKDAIIALETAVGITGDPATIVSRILDADVTYYVDCVAGSDANDGLTPATAFEHIQYAVNKLPKDFGGHVASISLVPSLLYNEAITIDNFYNGCLNFDYSSAGDVLITAPISSDVFAINNCRIYIDIEDIMMKVVSDSANCVSVQNSDCVTLTSCKVGDSGNTSTYGIYVTGRSLANVFDITDIDADKVAIGFHAILGSILFIDSGDTAGDIVSTTGSEGLIITGTSGITLSFPIAISNGGTGQATKAPAFDALSPMDALGDMIVGGVSGTGTKLAIGGTGTLLHGGTTPSYSAVVESDISLSANTTNNVSAAKHGFTPILPGSSTYFLDGAGNWTTPAGTVNSYLAQAFNTTTSIVVTHGFGAYPIVQVIDDSLAMLIPQSIVNNSLNQLTVTLAENTTGTVICSVGSPQAASVRIVTNNYVIVAATDRIIQCSASGKQMTLPSAVTSIGLEFMIDNSSTGSITVISVAGTIEGQSTQTIPSNSSLNVYADGTNWRIC